MEIRQRLKHLYTREVIEIAPLHTHLCGARLPFPGTVRSFAAAQKL
jgi:hypothetical protein